MSRTKGGGAGRAPAAVGAPQSFQDEAPGAPDDDVPF